MKWKVFSKTSEPASFSNLTVKAVAPTAILYEGDSPSGMAKHLRQFVRWDLLMNIWPK
jgi:hypothetical protein